MTDDSLKIAVIGMAGRFPGAENIDQFWHNLQTGTTGGVQLSSVKDGLVHYGFPLPDADKFDADFFDISSREAKMLDPQHRLFLEYSYAALEHAGIAPKTNSALTGVFASCNFNGYALRLAQQIRHARPVELVDMLAACDKDYIASRVAYKLNLKGPALAVQCACSSSLASIALACQSLLSAQCDLALAGGVGLKTGEYEGYAYEPEGPLSIDGHIRAYSDDATGVNEGEGVGVVVLKRLEDALKDHDVIYAVITGYAIGNDGSEKTGYYAPSVSGQSSVIADALAMSGISPLEIGYVEGHGTGTPIGDPMEVAALTQAWQLPDNAPKQYCYLGSVKTSIGHLNAAAGVAGLIKTVLSLYHQTIPESLDFHAPNPRLSLEKTPFRVAQHSEVWNVAPGKKRIAAVNSLGIGGNNVHLILEEGPRIQKKEQNTLSLITLSAKTKTALEKRSKELATWLRTQPEISLADIAHTLLLGRDMHSFRVSIACENRESLLQALDSPGLLRRSTKLTDPAKSVPVAFLFPGFGSQHIEMALDLKKQFPIFEKIFNNICSIFLNEVKIDVFSSLRDPAQLQDTVVGTCALFCVEYSLAKFLQELGISPSYVMGHSAGEYVAATFAGIFSETDAARLIAERSRLIENSPNGGMLFIPLSEKELTQQLPQRISVSAIITPNGCVVSGSKEDIEKLQLNLATKNISFSRIAADKAGHSSLLDGVVPSLREYLKKIVLHAPTIPILSNVTGRWLTDYEAVDPEYWTRQMRAPVRLSDEISELCATGDVILLEVGPSRKLSAMLRRHPAFAGRSPIIPVMPAEQGKNTESYALLEAIGAIWQQGGSADWKKIETLNGGGRTVALPTYPFERHRFWLDTIREEKENESEGPRVSALCWQEMLLPDASISRESIVVLGEKTSTLVQELLQCGWNAISVHSVKELKQTKISPDILLDCRFLEQNKDSLNAAADSCSRAIELCAWLSEFADAQPRSVYWLTRGATSFGTELPRFDTSILLAPARVLPFEAKNTFGCVIDIGDNSLEKNDIKAIEKVIGNHIATHALTSLIAIRFGKIWQEVPTELSVPATIASPIILKDKCSYLILGGSGGIGQKFMEELSAAALSQHCHITLIPIQRQSHSVDFWERCNNEWVTIVPFSLDFKNLDTIKEIVDKINLQYGPLKGIIHASGVTGGGLMQAMSYKIQDMQNWSAKVIPLLYIDNILHTENLDFVILNTSIGALCGAVGQLDNTAANILLDTWASKNQHQSQTQIRSIRWDVWHQVGMINKIAELHERLSGETLKGGITPDDAGKVLSQCITCPTELPIVSSRSLFIMLEEARAKRGLATEVLESADIRSEGENSPRPILSVAWRGARHTLDKILISLFEARLSLKGIGIDDDYIELGGDSLMAMPLAKEIRELFDLPSFTVAQIFRNRTVAKIADTLTQSPEEKSRLFALAELLESVKQMTPEEVSRSLGATS